MKINFDTLFASGNETALRNAFSWLTRIGAAPAFGSRPIGWYQQHQCAALDVLKEFTDREVEFRCRSGVIWRKTAAHGWVRVTSARSLYDAADRKCRIAQETTP